MISFEICFSTDRFAWTSLLTPDKFDIVISKYRSYHILLDITIKGSEFLRLINN